MKQHFSILIKFFLGLQGEPLLPEGTSAPVETPVAIEVIESDPDDVVDLQDAALEKV